MQIPHFNPYARMVKKYLVQMLEDRYTEQIDEATDRMVAALVTQKDAENLTKLLYEVYQTGYHKALDSTREAMAKKGMKIKIISPKREGLH